MTISTKGPDVDLLHTNVLVYAVDQSGPHHAAAKAILDLGTQPDAGLCVASQTVAEFYAVVTNPRRVKEPLSPTEGLDLVQAILAMPGISLIPMPVDIVRR